MARLLDARIAFRFPVVLAGAMLATGRRTAASWFRCAGVKDDWDRFYDALRSVGRNARSMAMPIAQFIVKKFEPGEGGCWTLAIDDSPTKRYGRHVDGANIHHNPTAGPGDGPWLYGHNWVCLAMVLKHHLFGAIALPLLSRLYVRSVDVPKLKERYKWEFRTKHQLALELLLNVIRTLRALGSKAGYRAVFDGAYASRDLIRPLIAEGVAVVTRLRCDAKLFSLPVQQSGRGRPRKYGKTRVSLAKRAGHPGGWDTVSYSCRGEKVESKYKTFLATSQIVGGVIRVVLLKHRNGKWAAYMSTDESMTAKSILATVADRWAIEEVFHDVKEIWGAGEQQVRNIWTNVGCWHICTWLYTLVELACWDQPSEQLVDRTDRPWDNPDRRPSHTDRRRRIAREMLRQEFSIDLHGTPDRTKFRDQFERLLALAI